MASTGLPTPDPRWALFLDFDGTLVELAEHPDCVRPSAGLVPLLRRLAQCLDGAVAIVSGRSVTALDSFLTPLNLPTAGVHGLERRDASGRSHGGETQDRVPRRARELLARWVERNPGTLLEDKGSALALHYRRAPGREAASRRLMARVCRGLGEGYRVQPGKAVLELRRDTHDKGSAVAAFLDETPFAGRIPVVIGDDVTDEDAFRVARSRGGHGIAVGPAAVDPSAANARIDSVQGVLQWLSEAAESLERARASG